MITRKATILTAVLSMAVYYSPEVEASTFAGAQNQTQRDETLKLIQEACYKGLALWEKSFTREERSGETKQFKYELKRIKEQVGKEEPLEEIAHQLAVLNSIILEIAEVDKDSHLETHTFNTRYQYKLRARWFTALDDINGFYGWLGNLKSDKFSEHITQSLSQAANDPDISTWNPMLEGQVNDGPMPRLINKKFGHLSTDEARALIIGLHAKEGEILERALTGMKEKSQAREACRPLWEIKDLISSLEGLYLSRNEEAKNRLAEYRKASGIFQTRNNLEEMFELNHGEIHDVKMSLAKLSEEQISNRKRELARALNKLPRYKNKVLSIDKQYYIKSDQTSQHQQATIPQAPTKQPTPITSSYSKATTPLTNTCQGDYCQDNETLTTTSYNQGGPEEHDSKHEYNSECPNGECPSTAYQTSPNSNLAPDLRKSECPDTESCDSNQRYIDYHNDNVKFTETYFTEHKSKILNRVSSQEKLSFQELLRILLNDGNSLKQMVGDPMISKASSLVRQVAKHRELEASEKAILTLDNKAPLTVTHSTKTSDTISDPESRPHIKARVVKFLSQRHLIDMPTSPSQQLSSLARGHEHLLSLASQISSLLSQQTHLKGDARNLQKELTLKILDLQQTVSQIESTRPLISRVEKTMEANLSPLRKPYDETLALVTQYPQILGKNLWKRIANLMS